MITRKELDEYLQSIGGLVSDVFTDRPPISIYSGFFETGDGWNELIRDLIKEIIALGWDKKIVQVKEKFGGLRFYIDSASHEIHDAINRAEDKSYKICEACGTPGELRIRSWILTLCDNCNEKK